MNNYKDYEQSKKNILSKGQIFLYLNPPNIWCAVDLPTSAHPAHQMVSLISTIVLFCRLKDSKWLLKGKGYVNVCH